MRPLHLEKLYKYSSHVPLALAREVFLVFVALYTVVPTLIKKNVSVTLLRHTYILFLLATYPA